MATIGVLALQGDFEKHSKVLDTLTIPHKKVRSPKDLEEIDAMVIPGGESTTMGKLLVGEELLLPVREKIQLGMPVFGTCAGMILLAKELVNCNQPLIGLMDVIVERNAYGRQIESFETTISSSYFPATPLKAVFIRAPRIREIGDNVEVLAEFEKTPVLIRQGHMLAASFHPELTDDTRIHEYFLSIVEGKDGRRET